MKLKEWTKSSYKSAEKYQERRKATMKILAGTTEV